MIDHAWWCKNFLKIEIEWGGKNGHNCKVVEHRKLRRFAITHIALAPKGDEKWDAQNFINTKICYTKKIWSKNEVQKIFQKREKNTFRITNFLSRPKKHQKKISENFPNFTKFYQISTISKISCENGINFMWKSEKFQNFMWRTSRNQKMCSVRWKVGKKWGLVSTPPEPIRPLDTEIGLIQDTKPSHR